MAGTTPSVVGREQLLTRLLQTLRSGPKAVALIGESGIGKTAVLAEVVASMSADWIWKTQCMEVEVNLGLAVLGDLFAAIPQAVVDRLPTPQRLAVDVVLFRSVADGATVVDDRLLGATTLSLLRELATRGSVLLAIDDLQWCDPTSFAALDYAIRRTESAQVMVVATRRRSSGADFSAAELIQVPPLQQASVIKLIRRDTGEHLGAARIREIAEASAGNPLFALELARHAARDPSATGLPASLREALDRRLRLVNRSTRSVLLDVAVRGSPSVSDADLDDVGDAIGAELVVVREGRYRFAHPLIATAITESASPAELRAAHARAAVVAHDAITAALHRAHSSPPSDDLAAELDAAAALALRRGDRPGARRLAELALSMTPSGQRPADRLLRLAELENSQGNTRRSHELAEELLETAQTPHMTVQATQLLVDKIEAENPQRAIDSLLQVSRLPGIAAADLCEVVDNAALRMFFHGRAREAIPLLEQTITAVGPDTAEGAWLIGCASYIQRFSGMPGDDERLDAAVTRIRRSYDAGDDLPTCAYLVLGYAGVIATSDDRHAVARALLEQSETMAAEHGQRDPASYYRGLLALRRGQLDVAIRLLEDALETDAPNPSGLARVAMAHVVKGNLDDAARCIELGRQIGGSGLPPSRAWPELLCATGVLHLIVGKPDSAWPELREAADALDSLDCREPSLPPVLPAAVEAAAAVGELDQAQALSRRLEREASAVGSRWGLAAARRCHGFLSQARGELDAAAAAFTESADAFIALEVPVEAGRSLLALGALLRRSGQRKRARDVLQRGADIFATCGASGLAAATDAELARIGGRVAGDPDALTEAERQVAELVATGQSNAEVARTLHLSVKTIEAHLSRAYRKLGVQRRSQLAARLARPRD